MSKSNFIRLSGWFFIIGAIAFLRPAILQLDYGSRTISPLMTNTFFGAPVLLVAGLLGLRARYKIGGGVLLFGAIVGGLLLIVGMLGQSLSPSYSAGVPYFGVWIGGLLVLHFSLFIFGILMLIQKPLPRWNWIPLVAGMWVPLLLLLSGILGDRNSPPLKVLVITVFVMMTVTQAVLGYMLQAGVRHEMAAA